MVSYQVFVSMNIADVMLLWNRFSHIIMKTAHDDLVGRLKQYEQQANQLKVLYVLQPMKTLKKCRLSLPLQANVFFAYFLCCRKLFALLLAFVVLLNADYKRPYIVGIN